MKTFFIIPFTSYKRTKSAEFLYCSKAKQKCENFPLHLKFDSSKSQDLLTINFCVLSCNTNTFCTSEWS